MSGVAKKKNVLNLVNLHVACNSDADIRAVV